MNRRQKYILKFLAIFNLDIWFAEKFFKWHVDYGIFDSDVHFHVGRNHWVVRKSDYTKKRTKNTYGREQFIRQQIMDLERMPTQALINGIAIISQSRCPEFYEQQQVNVKNYAIEKRKLHYIIGKE